MFVQQKLALISCQIARSPTNQIFDRSWNCSHKTNTDRKTDIKPERDPSLIAFSPEETIVADGKAEDFAQQVQHSDVPAQPPNDSPSAATARKAVRDSKPAGDKDDGMGRCTEVFGGMHRKSMTITKTDFGHPGHERLHRTTRRKFTYVVSATGSDGRRYFAEFSEEELKDFPPHRRTADNAPKMRSGKSLFEGSRITSAYGLEQEVELLTAIE